MASVNGKDQNGKSKRRFFYLKIFGCILLIGFVSAVYYKNKPYCLADDASKKEVITYILKNNLSVYKKGLFEMRGRNSDAYTDFLEESIQSMPICCWADREKGHMADGHFFNTVGDFYYSFSMIAPKPSINKNEADDVKDLYVYFVKYFDKCGRQIESRMEDMTKEKYDHKIEMQKKRWLLEGQKQHAGK